MQALSQSLTTAIAPVRTEVLSVLFAAVVGIGIIFVAGHVQAYTLHEAAHDVRHATGFPCH